MALGLFEQISAINTKIKRLCCRIDQCCNAGFTVTELSLASQSYTITEQGWYIITGRDVTQTNTLIFSAVTGLDGKRVIVTNRTSGFITVSGAIPEYQGFKTDYTTHYIPAGYTYEFIANETSGYWSCLSPTPAPFFENLSYSADYSIKVPGVYHFSNAAGATYTVNLPDPQMYPGTTITIVNGDTTSGQSITFGGTFAIKIVKPNGNIIPDLSAGVSYTLTSVNAQWIRTAIAN